MEGPLSVFGDRSTGEAIRSQNGKGGRILGLTRGGAGLGPAAVGGPGLPAWHSEVLSGEARPPWIGPQWPAVSAPLRPTV